jgi:hypothetical protein
MRRPAIGKVGLLLEYAWRCGTLAISVTVLADPSTRSGVMVLGVFVFVGTVVVMLKAAGAPRPQAGGDDAGNGVAVGAEHTGPREQNGSVLRLRDSRERRTEGRDGDA